MNVTPVRARAKTVRKCIVVGVGSMQRRKAVVPESSSLYLGTSGSEEDSCSRHVSINPDALLLILACHRWIFGTEPYHYPSRCSEAHISALKAPSASGCLETNDI